MGRATKVREANIQHFTELGVKRDTELARIAMFYVPFYVVCYGVNLKKRYIFLPPSEANVIGLSTKLKSALGKAKIKQLLVPRLELANSLMDNLQVLTEQNVVFETEIRELGEKINILNSGSMRESIQKGLVQIRNEGWLSEKEQEELSQKIL